jgi:hypothetical protein
VQIGRVRATTVATVAYVDAAISEFSMITSPIKVVISLPNNMAWSCRGNRFFHRHRSHKSFGY